MNVLALLLFLCFYSIVAAQNKFDSSLLPRPLILEHYDILETKPEERDIQLHCMSWRFAVETNNLQSWRTIPIECADYVKDYMVNGHYGSDLKMVSNEARNYASRLELAGDGKDIWIFDIDETLLSNLPYYVDHGFGLEVFNANEFDNWVDLAMAPAIQSSLKLYQDLLGLGFKLFLLTGRSEGQRESTVQNLRNAGFTDWDRLILRDTSDQGKPAKIYKSEKRREMEKEGYRILGNSGDQWSDLLGSAMGDRLFKLPNPMYYIA